MRPGTVPLNLVHIGSMDEENKHADRRMDVCRVFFSQDEWFESVRQCMIFHHQVL